MNIGRKSILKKTMALLLSAACVAVFVPSVSFAAGNYITAYDVDALTIISSEAPAVTNGGNAKVTVGTSTFDAAADSKDEAGHWTWTASKTAYDKTKAVSAENCSGTLALNGLTLKSSSGAYAISVPAGAVISVKGTNSVENSGTGTSTAAIAAAGDVLFTGDGELTATDAQTAEASKSAVTAGITAAGKLDNEAVSVTATGGVAAASGDAAKSMSAGVIAIGGISSAYGSLSGYSGTIKSGVNDGTMAGICSYGNVTATDSSVIYGTAVKEAGDTVCKIIAVGMYVVGDTSSSGKAFVGGAAEAADYISAGYIAKGNITAEGGNISGDAAAAKVNVGITASGNISAKKGNILGAAEDAIDESCGVRANKDITLRGGYISATSGDTSADSTSEKAMSIGLASVNGNVTVYSGKVFASAGVTATSTSSCGIAAGADWSRTDFTVKQGTIYIYKGSVIARSDGGAACYAKNELYISDSRLVRVNYDGSKGYKTNGYQDRGYVVYTKGNAVHSASDVLIKPAAVKAGNSIVSGNLKYKVTTNNTSTSAFDYLFMGGKTAVAGFAAGKSAATVSVPDVLDHGELSYYISGISKNAFANNTKLTKVNIDAMITYIGSGAFSGDKNLKTINITTGYIKSVGANAFSGISSNAKINVPDNKIKAYKALFLKAGMPSTVKVF